VLLLIALWLVPGGSSAQTGAPNASNVTLVGALDTPGEAGAVAVLTSGSASYAYVADGQSGLRVLDVTSRASPRELGSLPAPNSCPAVGAHPDCGPAFVSDVAISGGVLFRTDSKRQYCTNQGCVDNPESGLRALDISNPASPREVGFLHTPGEARRVALAGRYAYLADGAGGFRVIDLADPTRPTQVGADTSRWADDVVVSGSHAFVASSGDIALLVFDVSNPAQPTLVGRSQVPALGLGSGLALAGRYAYLSSSSDTQGLRVFDVSDPTRPTPVATFPVSTFTHKPAIAGSYLYLPAASQGLRVLSIANPLDPVEVGFYDTPGTATRVAVDAADLFVGDGSAGLQILRFTAADAGAQPIQAWLPVVLKTSGWSALPGTFDASVLVGAAGALPSGGALCQLQILDANGGVAAQTAGEPLSSTSRLYFLPELASLPTGRYAAVVRCAEPVLAQANLLASAPRMGATYRAVRAGEQAATVYLTGVFKSYVGYSSVVSIQNAANASANVTVTHRDQSGAAVGDPVQLTIPANGFADVAQAAAGLSDGFVGSATVASSQPVAAVVHVAHGGGELTASTGISSGDTRVELPAVYKSYSSDGWISTVFVQNVDSQPAAVRLTFRGPGGSAYTFEDTIAPGAARQYWQGNAPADLPNGFVGTATVESTNGRRVAALVNTRNSAGHLSAAAGVVQAGPPTYAPLTQRLRFLDLYNGYSPLRWVSSVLVENVDQSADATVTFRYFREGETSPTLSVTDTIRPAQSHLRYLPNEQLPVGWRGVAVVESSGGRIVGVGNSLALGESTGGDWLLTYEAHGAP
jgi:hypothetical protein